MVEEASTNIWDAITHGISLGAGVVTGGATLVVEGLFNALTAATDSDSTVLNNIRAQMSSQNIVLQLNSCNNSIINLQENIIRGVSVECIQLYIDAGFTFEQIQELTTVDISDVTQENSSIAISTCQINAMMDMLNKLDMSIDVLALQDAMNKAVGLF